MVINRKKTKQRLEPRESAIKGNNGPDVKDTNQNITGRLAGFPLVHCCFSELFPKLVEEKSQRLLSNRGDKKSFNVILGYFCKGTIRVAAASLLICSAAVWPAHTWVVFSPVFLLRCRHGFYSGRLAVQLHLKLVGCATHVNLMLKPPGFITFTTYFAVYLRCQRLVLPFSLFHSVSSSFSPLLASLFSYWCHFAFSARCLFIF